MTTGGILTTASPMQHGRGRRLDIGKDRVGSITVQRSDRMMPPSQRRGIGHSRHRTVDDTGQDQEIPQKLMPRTGQHAFRMKLNTHCRVFAMGHRHHQPVPSPGRDLPCGWQLLGLDDQRVISCRDQWSGTTA